MNLKVRQEGGGEANGREEGRARSPSPEPPSPKPEARSPKPRSPSPEAPKPRGPKPEAPKPEALRWGGGGGGWPRDFPLGQPGSRGACVIGLTSVARPILLRTSV